MSQATLFQSIIMKLQEFWAARGCLIWQPYYAQVGAGTMNPGTFLRVLGPEPWNVAYVEPSIRPDDGRYGENPNRMQMHYQFQVILKPDPGNPQEIYLDSLQALGIDPHKHDIRFVEDNWEQPALGAWGLGWEVWLDGQEITQFTYFQQAGGQTLDPVSVEITYGLERIAIALQRVNSFREIQWSPTLTDGDVNLQAEQEHSRYYFEVADISRLWQMYDLFEAEANACLEQNLVLPAYDYILKCSHTFNVLDTRGAVGVTERQAIFGRMRDLARRVSAAYLAQRQRLGYPWLKEEQNTPLPYTAVASTSTRKLPLPGVESSQPFLLEIGTEELPPDDLAKALDQLEDRAPALLEELRLEHGEIKIMGTPRRLAVYVESLAPYQRDLEQVVKGPPADRAFDGDGNPTRAAQGFARSRGVRLEDLELREIEGGRYAVAVLRQAGRPTLEVLSAALPGLIGSLRFEKTMRWNHTNISFSRPIRWLMALYGEKTVSFECAGLQSGAVTRGLRFQSPEYISVKNPTEYFNVMKRQGILLDPEERKSEIYAQIVHLAGRVNGKADADPALLAEVTHLVEAPQALLGSFDPVHLKLPRQVLVSVMKKHQRYFPLGETASPDEGDAKEATLLPYFIAVCNGRRELYDLILEGNEHVIRARFADANYFVREDQKKPLEAYLPRLGTLTFEVHLGSMLDKTRRITALVEKLAEPMGLTPEEEKITRRAAELCKADLATQMVVEMTSLQGQMGRYYALRSGEPEAVALAIYEHYLPRYAGDAIPKSRPGLLVGIADRLDTLAGLFAAGLAPSGNKDPFAQRRAALGLVQNLIAWNLDFDIALGLRAAADLLPIPASVESQAAVKEFLVERLRNALLDQGWRYDVVDAILAVQGSNPAGAARAVRQMSKWTKRPDWNDILPTYARCVRITREFSETFPVDKEILVEPSEQLLEEAVQSAEAAVRAPGSVDDFLDAFLPLMPVIKRFFDDVLVMAEDIRLRQNRLGLLQRVAALASGVADMSRLEGF